MSVLIVDDNKFNIELVLSILKNKVAISKRVYDAISK